MTTPAKPKKPHVKDLSLGGAWRGVKSLNGWLYTESRNPRNAEDITFQKNRYSLTLRHCNEVSWLEGWSVLLQREDNGAPMTLKEGVSKITAHKFAREFMLLN